MGIYHAHQLCGGKLAVDARVMFAQVAHAYDHDGNALGHHGGPLR
jgi:hypothetical protein